MKELCDEAYDAADALEDDSQDQLITRHQNRGQRQHISERKCRAFVEDLTFLNCEFLCGLCGSSAQRMHRGPQRNTFKLRHQLDRFQWSWSPQLTIPVGSYRGQENQSDGGFTLPRLMVHCYCSAERSWKCDAPYGERLEIFRPGRHPSVQRPAGFDHQSVTR